MASTTVKVGQTLEDIAIQHLGSAEAAFSLAVVNDLEYTEQLLPGMVLILQEVYDKRVQRVYNQQGWKPANAVTLLEEGIDFWGIEVDFEVQ
ncbi:MAG: LysM domain-containing protein [Bacteroidetes bacterium]|nr:MAG: LysM domain-containing protein [Bacteroidota bacterium]